MKQWKMFLLLLGTVSIMFLFAGCWNYKEIEKSAIVAGIAIDKGRNGSKYHLTYEILSFSGGKDQSIKSFFIEADGDSVFDAIRGAVKMSDKKLYFSNCRIVIVSKDIAREGIKPLTDFLLRDTEPRITLLFAVSDEETAAKILEIQLKTNEPVSFKIYGILEQSQQTLGHALSIPLYQMYNVMSTKSQSMTLPNIRLEKVDDNQEPQLSTNVIFLKDKMVGYMPQNENLYYLILKNKIKSGIILTGIKTGEKDIALEILKSNVKMKPIVNGDNVKMKIQVKMDVSLGEENDENEKYKVEKGEFKKIEQAASKTVEEGLMKLILDTQNNYGADIFGFGAKINQDKYDDWIKISQDWDRIFPKVKCEIVADIKILSSATALPKGSD